MANWLCAGQGSLAPIITKLVLFQPQYKILKHKPYLIFKETKFQEAQLSNIADSVPERLQAQRRLPPQDCPAGFSDREKSVSSNAG